MKALQQNHREQQVSAFNTTLDPIQVIGSRRSFCFVPQLSNKASTFTNPFNLALPASEGQTIFSWNSNRDPLKINLTFKE